MCNKRTLLTKQKGFAALLVVVIIATTVLVIVTNASFLGIGEVTLGFISLRGNEALHTAEGCVEETIRQLRIDPLYGLGTGQIGLSMPQGSCTIEVTAKEALRTIIATSSIDTFHKVIEIQGVYSTSSNHFLITSREER
jgi:hypothetical protein